MAPAGAAACRRELGGKWRSGEVDVDAVLFQADTRDEIGVQSSSGGRSTFRNVGRMPVDDLNSDFAGGSGIVNLRWQQQWSAGGTRIELVARIDNVANRRYAGSVIVNESSGRFFEPAAPRSLWLGLRLSAP